MAADEKAASDLRVRLADTDIRVASGQEGLLEAAALESADTVLTAVVGVAGLEPTLCAVRRESESHWPIKKLWSAPGSFVMDEAEARCGAEIVPVDSEHSAIFQCLQGSGDRREVRRLILTASGGPFYGWSREQLRR